MGSGHNSFKFFSDLYAYYLIYIMETHLTFINALFIVIKMCLNSINNIKHIELASLKVNFDNLHSAQHILIKICIFRVTNSQEGII